MEFINIITNVGFPIACCLFLGKYVTDKDKERETSYRSNIEALRTDNREDKELLLKELQYSREVNSKVMGTNEMLVKEVIPKLDKVLQIVGDK
ncbi:MAG: hypothetical protein ACRCX2_37895 [Paraclostridium sp.]